MSTTIAYASLSSILPAVMIYCCYCVHNKHVFLVFDETELWDYGCASILVIHTQTDAYKPYYDTSDVIMVLLQLIK